MRGKIRVPPSLRSASIKTLVDILRLCVLVQILLELF